VDFFCLFDNLFHDFIFKKFLPHDAILVSASAALSP